MSDTPPSPESADRQGSPPATGAPTKATKGLPFGPFGMLVITAVALLVAGAVAWGVVAMTSSDKKSDAIDIKDALDGVEYTPSGQSKGIAKIGDSAPNVELEMIGGDSTTMAKVIGESRPVVVNFWSSTCAPCIKEMPALESVHSDVGDKVTFLGINTKDTEAAANKMIDRTKVTYTNARDPRGEIATQFGALALPRTVLIDANGKIVATHTGELTREKMIKMFKENGFPVP